MSNKPEPIPVMVKSRRFHCEAKLHRTVNGKAIVELRHPALLGTFVTVEPHEVHSLTFEQNKHRIEQVA